MKTNAIENNVDLKREKGRGDWIRHKLTNDCRIIEKIFRMRTHRNKNKHNECLKYRMRRCGYFLDAIYFELKFTIRRIQFI